VRAKEFLSEYNRDVTKKNYGDKIVLRWGVGAVSSGLSIRRVHDKILAGEPLDVNEQNVYDEAVANIINKAEIADPTPNKQYVQWLVRAWINKLLRLAEDILSSGSEFVKMWHELKTHRMLPPNYTDINRIKTPSDWNQAWVDIRAAYQNFKPKKPMPKGKARELLNNAEVRIIRPENEAAACYYGQGTQWCTAATESRNLFDQYHKDGDLSIIIPKNPRYEGEKYQLWVNNDTGGYQLMNEQDDPLEYGIEELTDRFNTLTDEILEKLHPALMKHPEFNTEEFESVKRQIAVNLFKNGYFKLAYSDLINMLDDSFDEYDRDSINYMKEMFMEMEAEVLRAINNVRYDELAFNDPGVTFSELPNAVFRWLEYMTDDTNMWGDWADDEYMVGFINNIEAWFNRQTNWDKRNQNQTLIPYYSIKQDEKTGKWEVEYEGPWT